MTILQKHINRLKQLRDLYEVGSPQHNCFSIAMNEAYAEIENEKEQITSAHMSGQRNAGVDASWNEANCYYRDIAV